MPRRGAERWNGRITAGDQGAGAGLDRAARSAVMASTGPWALSGGGPAPRWGAGEPRGPRKLAAGVGLPRVGGRGPAPRRSRLAHAAVALQHLRQLVPRPGRLRPKPQRLGVRGGRLAMPRAAEVQG